MDITFDTSELDALVSDLKRAGQTLPQRIRPVVQKGALNVKNGMRADMAASPHFGQVAASITYESKEGRDFAEAEIGAETGGQVVGDLAHFAYFGGSPSGGGSVRDPQAVLDEEAPRFTKALEALVKDLM